MLRADAALEVFDEIDSTILEARRRAEGGDFGPVWLLAHAQTAGRGRRGRTWSSIPGNLMVTYLGVTDAKPAQIALLGFATGVALAETVDSLAGPGRATLKWPNDLFLDGAKAAGIMLDSGAAPGGQWIALAFGFNIAGAPDALDQDTAALKDVLPDGEALPSPELLLAMVRMRLELYAARLPLDGFEPLREAWLARAHGLGGPARVVLGTETIDGRIVGLSPRGELELETPNGVRLIAAGDGLLPAPTA